MAKSHRNLDPLTGDDVLLDAEVQREELEELRYERVFCGEHDGHEDVEVEFFGYIDPWCPVAMEYISEVIPDTPINTLIMRGIRLKQRFIR